MDILIKPINSFTFGDIVSFAKEKNQEGVQIDYKEVFPDKKKLSQLVTAFANTRGGVIIVGIKEDRNTGQPIKYEGINDSHYDEFVAQIIGNISPIPAYEYYKTPPSNGKVFVLIRVFEGQETPYYSHNDSNIWIRTGSIKKAIDIASPEHIDLLFRKSERAELGRMHNRDRANFNYKAFLNNAEQERLKETALEEENYRIKKIQHEGGDTLPPFKSQVIQEFLGSNVAMLTIYLQPYYPHGQFIRPRDIEPIIQESEARNLHYAFPMRAIQWDSITEGMISFNWNHNDGGISCQQVFANGLIYCANNVLHLTSKQETYTHLAFFTSQLYTTLKGTNNILKKFKYQGSLIGNITIQGIQGHKIHPIVESIFGDIHRSVFDHRSWPINIDTQILSNEKKLRDYVTDISRDMHWSFGYKDLQKSIDVEILIKKQYFQD